MLMNFYIHETGLANIVLGLYADTTAVKYQVISLRVQCCDAGQRHTARHCMSADKIT